MGADDQEMDGVCPIAEQDALETLGKLSLPEQRRVRALKKLQLAEIGLEVDFNEQLNSLERKFQPLYDEINMRRKAIVMGEYEPMDDECDVPLLHDASEELIKKIEACAPPDKNSKGIPNFWLNTMMRSVELEGSISAEDEEILKYLEDITVELHTKDPGFTLLFHFAKGNPYIVDRVLKKSYVMTIGVDPDEPFDYDGATLLTATTDPITWCGGTRPIGAVFFEWFNPGTKIFDKTMSAEEEIGMRMDFEIATHILDSIIPKAVLYLTGEVAQEDEYIYSSSGSSTSSSDDQAPDGGTKKLRNGGEEADIPMEEDLE